MPINGSLRRQILSYCKRDIPTRSDVEQQYNFIDDTEILTAVVDEFLTARYIYKLGEALAVTKKDLAAHSKFQITQYASIYEAIIGWMLWDKLCLHPRVEELRQVKTLRKGPQLPNSMELRNNSGTELLIAEEKYVEAPQHKIKFSDKVVTAVELGFIDVALGNEIKEFFAARNGIHIENAIKNQIEYELDMAKRSFWRLQPFREGIRGFLATGSLPYHACIQPSQSKAASVTPP